MMRKSLKEQARDNLMHAMMNAFYDEDLNDTLRAEMHKQVNRVEKLFRYEINSWAS